MREILSKSLTVRGFINYEFAAEHYPAFLREVGDGIAVGRIRYRESLSTARRTRRKRLSACWREVTSVS
jgi:NADPH-dependent curcumin reductase CurA